MARSEMAAEEVIHGPTWDIEQASPSPQNAMQGARWDVERTSPLGPPTRGQ